MINILQLGFTPSRACWIVAEGNLVPEVALAEEGTNKIHVFDAKVCYLFTIMSLLSTGITTWQQFDF